MMGDLLIRALLPLSLRERWLIALCSGVVVPLAVILGLLLPMAEARQRAADDLAQARTTTLWVVDQVGEARASGLSDVTSTVDLVAQVTPIGSSGLEETLITAGLRPSVRELGQSETGTITLRFEQVRFKRLAEWMSAWDTNWGYDITQLQIEATETSGLVLASLTLTPVTGGSR